MPAAGGVVGACRVPALAGRSAEPKGETDMPKDTLIGAGRAAAIAAGIGATGAQSDIRGDFAVIGCAPCKTDPVWPLCARAGERHFSGNASIGPYQSRHNLAGALGEGEWRRHREAVRGDRVAAGGRAPLAVRQSMRVDAVAQMSRPDVDAIDEHRDPLLFLVATFRSGPVPRVVMMMIRSAGFTGKLSGAAVEEVDYHPAMPVEAAGAARLRGIADACVPQAMSSRRAGPVPGWDVDLPGSVSLNLMTENVIAIILPEVIGTSDRVEAATTLPSVAVLVVVAAHASSGLRWRVL